MRIFADFEVLLHLLLLFPYITLLAAGNSERLPIASRTAPQQRVRSLSSPGFRGLLRKDAQLSLPPSPSHGSIPAPSLNRQRAPLALLQCQYALCRLSAKGANILNASPHSRRRSKNFLTGSCDHTICAATKMQEKQRELLSSSLIKLDAFCRNVLAKEASEGRPDQHLLAGEVWNHTLFPSAFKLLSEDCAVRGSPIGLVNSVRGTAGSAGEDQKNPSSEIGNNCSPFEVFCKMMSVALGIPVGCERKHRLAARGEGAEAERRSARAEDALLLPTSRQIGEVAKQIKRFPYGLLSIASLRKREDHEAGAAGEEAAAAGKGEDEGAEQQVPQVLTVSPFWIAASPQKKFKTHSHSFDSRQLLIDSVAQAVEVGAALEEDERSVAAITPFPTTFWLSDLRLTAKLSEAELTGWMKGMENGVLLSDAGLQEAVICDNLRFISLRWVLTPRVFLSHFYSANQRCGSCRKHKPEGHVFPEYEREKLSHFSQQVESQDAAEAEETERMTAGSLAGKTEKCDECLECTCRLCKLLQCHRVRGVGGLLNFCRIRCLHMQYAHHLACPTTLGNLIDDAFGVHAFAA